MPYYQPLASVQMWDISDRANPELARETEFEGSYLTSRKIGDSVYFVVNTYPQVYSLTAEQAAGNESIIPLYMDTASSQGKFVPSCGCHEVGYIVPGPVQSFITFVSISISDPEAEIRKEVIVGSGQMAYASAENIFIAEYSSYPVLRTIALPADSQPGLASEPEEPRETTAIHKFSLDSGQIAYQGSGDVPGRLLNQFSMDEYQGYLRVATTRGFSWGEAGSSNNIYVLDDGLEITGRLEGLAPGEQIYSARFAGARGYLVTFKKVDPLYVVDLSEPGSPEILGKLKIPGYSDYLHPYDENHIIGIGKEAAEAEEGDFAWYQGLKLALFDVTDVANPVEIHKAVIGDRGTDSEALHDHKAFLFDRERDLLVIPVLLAEFSQDPEELPEWSYGDYVFQGAYVYSLTTEGGFELRGTVTHFNDDEEFEKSGYYFGGGGYSVRRSLFIDGVLYTFSDNRLKLNDLSRLDELASLDFGDPAQGYYDGLTRGMPV
jgi:hypothetical protein